MKLALTLILVLLSFSGCTKHSEDDGISQIFYGSYADDIKSLDPANGNDVYSTEVISLMYESLYQYSYLEAPYKIVPLLAADLPKYSKDRLTLTIPLRKKVYFQDHKIFKATQGKGREVTAQDFIYSWNRLSDPKLNSTGRWIFEDKIKSFKALDSYTIQIQLTKPYPQLEQVLAMTYGAAVPHEAVEQLGDSNGNLTDQAVGSGPFQFKLWDRNHKIVLVRNPTYHIDFYPSVASPKYEKAGLLADQAKRIPFLDKVIFTVIRETQPAWLNFLSGKLDRLVLAKDQYQSALDASQKSISKELADKGIRLSVEPTGWFYYVAFSAKDPLLGKNKLLRQALASSIDRKKWVALFTQNQGVIADQALPPNTPDRPFGLTLKYDYNLERAKSLLAKAGYPGGKNLPVIKLDMRGADSVSRQLGDFFTQAFGAIGVQTEVIFNTFPAFLEKSKNGNLQAYLGGWVMDYPDPENVWQLLYSKNHSPGPNDTYYSNPKFDQLYLKLASMQPGPARKELLKEIDTLIQEDCPWALGYTVTSHRLTQKWLKNFRYSDTILNSVKYYRVDLREKRNSQGN